MTGPMLLRPAEKDYLWGGTRLKTDYGKRTELVPLAETWECSTHPDGPSVVAAGVFAGQTLSKVLRKHPEFLGTRVRTKGELPILVKLIDAAQDLSLQVHPDDAYARHHEGQNGKTEFWYVLDAKPGASLVCGFAHAVTKRQLQEGIRTGHLNKHLQRVPVHRGDVFYIPAGTIHALGAGILVAEVQESSNVTYRVYDYDRVDKQGHRRPLHFDKAAEVLDMRPGADIRQRPRLVRYFPGCSRETLCRCEYFEVERIQVSTSCVLSGMDASFRVLLCVEGGGSVETHAGAIRFEKGNCVFLPAQQGEVQIKGTATVLSVHC